MPNGTANQEQESTELNVGKRRPPRWINFNVKKVDGHYLVTFRHDETRIFHNMEELLRAIEVEINRLDQSS